MNEGQLNPDVLVWLGDCIVEQLRVCATTAITASDNLSAFNATTSFAPV